MSLTQVSPPIAMPSGLFGNTHATSAPKNVSSQQYRTSPQTSKAKDTLTLNTNKSLEPEKESNIEYFNNFTRPGVSKNNTITVGGRKSLLAVVQSKHIAQSLYNVCPTQSFPVVALSTLGDLVQGKPLYSFGGKSLWTKELEWLMLNRIEGAPQIDIIVHSLKDMPTVLPDDCILGAITEREDPRDAVIMKANSPYTVLGDLPAGSVVGTSSIRRSAQLKKNFPHLLFESVRGNVQTRLRKLDDPKGKFECIILAVAGLKRLGLDERITSCLDAPDMYYAVGQGALGIEVRSKDAKVQELLKNINHDETYFRCLAERSLLRTLEGGCSVPIGVNTKFTDKETLEFTAIVVSVDGQESITKTLTQKVTSASEAEEIGEKLAQNLIQDGAKEILDAIKLEH